MQKIIVKEQHMNIRQLFFLQYFYKFLKFKQQLTNFCFSFLVFKEQKIYVV